MLVNLAHTLSPATPFYEGLARPGFNQVYSLAKGDACNSFYITTSNHAGTHVDGPNHFNPAGRRISEYSAEELRFTRPAILPLSVGAGHLITANDLAGLADVRRDCDVLLIRTGCGRWRESDPDRFVNRSPGFSRSAAECLLKALPELKAIVMDIISAASVLHMEEGCEAHRVFLGCAGYSDRNVLLVEDANLPESMPLPRQVLIVPWMFAEIDSAPCSVLAEI